MVWCDMAKRAAILVNRPRDSSCNNLATVDHSVVTCSCLRGKQHPTLTTGRAEAQQPSNFSRQQPEPRSAAPFGSTLPNYGKCGASRRYRNPISTPEATECDVHKDAYKAVATRTQIEQRIAARHQSCTEASHDILRVSTQV